MVEEDLDLTKTCPSCASPNISYNREGQTICRDCGNISPAGKVFGFGIYSKIKGIFRTKKKSRKTKKKKKSRFKGIKSILKRKKKIEKAKKKISKKKKAVKKKRKR